MPDTRTIVYLHGGAGIFGSPDDLDPRHRALLEDAGFAVVAIDYPKAIATPITHTLEAVRATVTGLAARAPHGQVIVMGHSFGGYLTLWLSATQPCVARAVAFAGYGDLLAGWYTRPSATYLALKDLGEVDPHAVTPASPFHEKLDLYLHLRQTGTWPDYVSKGDLAGLPGISPLHLPPAKVPVFLIHGTADTDVPHTASVAYYDAIAAAAPESRLYLHPGGGHSLFCEMDDPTVAAMWEQVVDFCRA